MYFFHFDLVSLVVATSFSTVLPVPPSTTPSLFTTLSMAIEINHITKQYGEQLALNDVTLNVGKGIVALLGPNGAGKSTLMKIITCFIPPTSGTVSVNGFDVMDSPMEVKKPSKKKSSPKRSLLKKPPKRIRQNPLPAMKLP